MAKRISVLYSSNGFFKIPLEIKVLMAAMSSRTDEDLCKLFKAAESGQIWARTDPELVKACRGINAPEIKIKDFQLEAGEHIMIGCPVAENPKIVKSINDF